MEFFLFLLQRRKYKKQTDFKLKNMQTNICVWMNICLSTRLEAHSICCVRLRWHNISILKLSVSVWIHFWPAYFSCAAWFSFVHIFFSNQFQKLSFCQNIWFIFPLLRACHHHLNPMCIIRFLWDFTLTLICFHDFIAQEMLWREHVFVTYRLCFVIEISVHVSFWKLNVSWQ